MFDLAPLHGSTAFMVDAACAGRPDDEWNDDDEGLAGQRRTSHAKWICTERCTVTAACLAYAIDNKIKHGVWGGTSQDERKAILSDRHRISLKPVRINTMPAKKTTHPSPTHPKGARGPSEAPTAAQKVRVEGTDLDRLTALRALADDQTRTQGLTAADWLARVDFEGTDDEFVEWIERQGQANALVVRDGGKLAVA